MVHLSFFNSPNHSQKTKKPSFETMVKMLQTSSQNEPAHNSSSSSTWFNQSSSPAEEAKDQTGIRRSEEIITRNNIRRSFSFGCAPYPGDLEDNNSEGNNTNTTEPEPSVTGSYDQHYSVGSPKSHPEASAASNQDPETRHPSTPPHGGSEKLTIETISSYIGKDEGAESGRSQDDSSNHNLHLTKQQMFARAQSVPNFTSMLPTTRRAGGGDQSQPSSSHCKDLQTLDTMGKQISSYQNESQDGSDDDLYDYAACGKDWLVPALDDDEGHVPDKKFHQETSSSSQEMMMPNKNFKMKRIEDWVTGLQECAQNEEPAKMVDTCDDQDQRPVMSMIDGGRDTAKPQLGVNHGAEAAHKYTFSLGANATTAQLTNHGLVVIPFLSAFVSLKVVNLSGNSIVKITSGALPRGLHMLNLSKNKISAIEGLRELTRLRVLDVSYNKITRIARGLASCSSLKELYLAGNKISEVDGLHRLLKLTVLDLRFNKISTTKGLGQLAANYNSLQAISVDGNPAQKNVGDEQLKKHLQGLLPNLAYYNRRNTNSKINSFKDSSERSIRSDRSHKTDHKLSRRASFSSLKQSGHHKNLNQSQRGTRSGRYGNLPLGKGNRNGHRHHHQYDQQFEMNMKPLDLKEFALRKSQSLGTFVGV